MLQTLFEIVLANAVLATVLAIGVALFARLCRRPAIAHGLWLLVFLKLITPPLVTVPLEILPAPPVISTSSAVIHAPVETTIIEHEAPTPSAIIATTEAPRLSLTPQPAGFPWRNYLVEGIVGLWIAGACGWLLLLGIRAWRFHRMARRIALAPVALQQQVRRLSTAFGVQAVPEVRMIQAQVSPLLWRIGGRPVILLPAELLTQLTPAQIDGILAHELAHLQRRDHWTRRLVLCVTALYWWHPVVWWSRRGLEQAAEQCCDAAVVARFPDHSRDYAAALLQTIDFLTGARPRLPASATTFGQARSLKRRFAMILDKGVSPRLSWKMRGVLVAVGLTVLVVSPWVVAEEPPNSKPNGGAPDWYSKSNQSEVVPSSQTKETHSAKKENTPNGGDKYSIKFRVAHRKGDSDEFVTTSEPHLIVRAQQDAILDTSQKRPVFVTWHTPAKGDYLLSFDVSDGWKVQLKLYRGREGWVTVDATFETNEFVAIEKKPIPDDKSHQPVRVQGQKLRVIEYVRLGEKVVVPFDGGTDFKTAKQRLEFTVTRLEPAKLKSPGEAVLISPSPVDDPPSAEEVLKLVGERLKKRGQIPQFATSAVVRNLRVVIEPSAGEIGPVKFYPLVGPAKMHKQRFKCTAYFDLQRQSDWPIRFTSREKTSEVVYINRDHLVRATKQPK
ncbi:Protease HtpX [Symmachiella dynata]|uniref:M56 family metallopeptidase n=1 Tax=Symmachiella dynata TaxID=2527995 RepID=UPI00118A494B|nr:M56 family metallopeptidase [Symmachiella dynata]QDT46364.1 Protease HtpX [Symmachiella dynata]